MTGVISAGDKWTFSINGKDASNVDVSYSTVKTLKEGVTFEPGVCYPITITDLSKVE